MGALTGPSDTPRPPADPKEGLKKKESEKENTGLDNKTQQVAKNVAPGKSEGTPASTPLPARPTASKSKLTLAKLNLPPLVIPAAAQTTPLPAYTTWSLEEFKTTPPTSDQTGLALTKELLGTVQLLISPAKDSATNLMPKSTHDEGKKGVSGSYFISNLTGMRIGIFKPDDEELGTMNCPDPHRRHPDELGVRFGIKPGLSATMECVAFLLGQDEGVPHTMLVTLPNLPSFAQDTPVATKRGSLQKFIPDAKEIHAISFADLVNKDEKYLTQMQTIALFDIKTFNTDRNQSNLLFANDKLFPIDHGCIAAAEFQDNVNFCWLSYPKVLDTPLSEEQKTRILQLDWAKDKKAILQQFPDLPKENLQTLEASYILLKCAAQNNLTIRTMASFLLPEMITGTEFAFERCVMYYLYKKAQSSSDFAGTMQRLMEETIKEMQSIQTEAINPKDPTCPELQKIRSRLYTEDIKSRASK